MSFAKLAAIVGAGILAMGMAGGFGDGKASAPDFSKLGQMFEVHDAKPAKKARKHTMSNEPPAMTCEGDQCWWTDLGQPDRQEEPHVQDGS